MADNDMARKIRELRMQHNLTLEQVANEVGVGKSTVRKWETGMIENMRRDKISSLAKALHTTPAYLMGWEPNENEKPADDGGLSQEKKELIEAIKNLPEDKIQVLLMVAKSIKNENK